jgi:hypothetical protein
MCGRAHANPTTRRAAHGLTNAQNVLQGSTSCPRTRCRAMPALPLSRTIEAVSSLCADAYEMSRRRASIDSNGGGLGIRVDQIRPNERLTSSAPLEQRGICGR